MSLADRVAKAKAERANGGAFIIPNGFYHCKLKDVSKFKSEKKGEDIIQFDLKVLSVKELDDKSLDNDVVIEQIKESKLKGTFEAGFLTRLDFQLDKVLEFVEDAGGDLSTCDENDTKFKDVMNLLEEVAEAQPKVLVRVTPNKVNPKRPNFSFYEVERVLGGGEAPQAPQAPAPAYTKEQLIAAGWTEDQIKLAYPEVI
jgi:hypothetical protein